MFSYRAIKGSRPIAVIETKGIEDNGNEREEEDEILPIYLMPEEYNKKHQKYTMNDVVLDDDQQISVLPRKEPDQRDCIFVAGRSGAGKSTFAANYARHYHNMFPKNKIYIFSALEQDPAFNNLPAYRIVLDDDIIDSDADYSQFQNCLVIFDDIDQLRNKKILAKVREIQNQILDMGRHRNINIISTSHMATNGHASRSLLNEANMVCVFHPKGNNTVKRYLETYSGLSKQNRDRILEKNPRWVAVHLNHPIYIVHDRGIFVPE